jgi:hypothetical protein
MRQVCRAALTLLWLSAGLPAAEAQSPSQSTPSISKSRAQPSAKPAAPAADPARADRERDLAKASEPMKFQRVRSASPTCGADCPEWISAEGRIMSNSTAAQFRRVISSLGDKKLPIFIHSAGGAVEEAYAMGRLIRAKGLSVSVTKSDILECATTDKECKALQAKGIKFANPKPNLSVCASSCVFVLAGGVQRHVGPLSLVGVHQFESRVTHVQVLQRYRMVPNPRTGEMTKEVISEERVSEKTVKTRTKSEVYDKTFRYFAELGVTAEPIMTLLTATPHESMHWLSPIEITSTKIATDRKTGTQMLGLAPMPTIPSQVAEQLARTSPSQQAAMAAKSAAIASSTATAAPMSAPSAGPSAPDGRLVRAIQEKLKESNCLEGGIVSVWGERSKKAVEKFAAATNLKLDPAQPNLDMFSTLRGAAKPNVCAQPE